MDIRRFLALILIIAVLLGTSVICAYADFSIAAVGDINFGGSLYHVSKRDGNRSFFKYTKNILQAQDLTFGNLECALSGRGKPRAGKKFTFWGDPAVAGALKNAGFDILSVANNHSKDFGEKAFIDTLESLKEKGITYIGGGNDQSEAYSPKTLKVKGKEVTFLAYSDVLPHGWPAYKNFSGVASFRDFKRVLEQVNTVSEKSDYVVVSIHWGKEMATSPLKSQIKKAHRIIDAGADLILGHHPHVIQGFEIYRGKLIAYSLGNFVFSPGSPLGRYSAILKVNLDKWGIKDAEVIPVFITGGSPGVMQGRRADRWIIEIQARCRTVGSNFWKITGDSILCYQTYRSNFPVAFFRLSRIKDL